jgi:hypothetical protein
MNHFPSSTLEIDFRHPGEAVIVLRAIIAAYTQIRPNADASGIPELSEHIEHAWAIWRIAWQKWSSTWPPMKRSFPATRRGAGA